MLSGRRRSLIATAVAAAVALPLLAASPAHATGSVVGADNVTKQVGGALATCTESQIGVSATELQPEVYAAAPGKGVVHGQSFYFQNQKGDIAARLARGERAKQIIKALKRDNITSPNPASDLWESFGSDSGNLILQRRQYLVASMNDAFGFTGTSDEPVVGTPPERKNLQVSDVTSRYRGSMGGNTLTNKAMVKRMKAAYRFSPDVVVELERVLNLNIRADHEALLRSRRNSSPLAERLLLSLTAGFRDGDGDRRCVENLGKSSDVAWLRVDNANGATSMNLRVTNRRGDAVQALAFLYYGCVVHGGSACSASVDA